MECEDRQTDPIDALAASAVGRVPALLAIKWQRMAASPFGFFRGAVSVDGCRPGRAAPYRHFTQLCGMPMFGTWARTPRRMGGWSSTSTTSTKPSGAPSSGM